MFLLTSLIPGGFLGLQHTRINVVSYKKLLELFIKTLAKSSTSFSPTGLVPILEDVLTTLI